MTIDQMFQAMRHRLSGKEYGGNGTVLHVMIDHFYDPASFTAAIDQFENHLAMRGVLGPMDPLQALGAEFLMRAAYIEPPVNDDEES